MATPGGGPLGRIVAFVVGALVLGASIFLGAIFLVGILGLMLIGGLVFGLRLWWFKRKMEQHSRTTGDIEAEYTEVEVKREQVSHGRADDWRR